jgi:membrane protein DedA with SNARE-associated domain
VIAGLSSTITDHIASQGVYAVFILMAIDAVFPAASELVMVVAGAVAAGVVQSAHGVTVFGIELGTGADAYVAMSLAGTLGYFVGALLGWWAGARGGRPLLERRGAWLHLDAAKLDRAERWFERWGNAGVLLGRITPVVRSFVSIPAGVFQMPLGPYAILTLIGSAVWAFAFAGIGYGLGSSYHRFHEDFRYVEYAVVAGVLVLAAYLIYAARVRSRRAEDPAR